jgi:L-cystine uptake protein TcyP (sodium:dicarboxylate symporter family)
LRTSVDAAGVTVIAATCDVASGAVLPHDQFESATTTVVVSVRPILDMSALRRTSIP